MSEGPPNLGPPNLGPPDLGGPKTEIKKETNPIVEKTPSKTISQSTSKPKQDIAGGLVYSQYIRKWGVLRRKFRKSFIELMSKEMRVNLHIATSNELFRDQLLAMMDGQISYLTDMKREIEEKKDPLSKKLKRRKKKPTKNVSSLVFERLIEKVSTEREKMRYGDIDIIKKVELELKKHVDTRLEPRSCFWTLILSGLMLHNIKSRVDEEFEILMRISLEYDNPYKHTLMLFLNFVYYLIQELPPFPKEDAVTNLRPNAKETGYSMAHWIKYRYETGSQYYMEYERFINYYVRSFGLIRGKAPDFRKNAYYNWLDRTFKALEKTFLSAELYQNMAKGQTIEGVIAGVIDQMEDALEKRKYDDQNNLLNQPLGGEGALNFLYWLLETAIHRFKTPNFAMQQDIRLNIKMFDFIPPTIKWVNELGEKLVVDWLGLDEEGDLDA